jgi:hypothetical protein
MFRIFYFRTVFFTQIIIFHFISNRLKRIPKIDPSSDNSDNSEDEEEEDDDDRLSTISGLSDLSGSDWKPTAGPFSWVQRQMLSGADPRSLLQVKIFIR